ncbi:MAG: DUF6386 family protein [Chthonomonadales bacterium]
MLEHRFSFTTITSVFVVFDETLLSHRLHDDDDWWTIFMDEPFEVNAGNMMLVLIHSDGIYDVTVHEHPVDDSESINCYVRCASGAMCLGPGEMLPGGDLGALKKYGGTINLPIGNYLVNVARTGDSALAVCFVPTDAEARNSFKGPQEV